MWSSCNFGMEGSTRCLVDSSDSTMHPYFVFRTSLDAFNFAPVSCGLHVTFGRFLQGIAASIGVSSFFLGSFYLQDRWSKFPSIFERYRAWVSLSPIFPFLFSERIYKILCMLLTTHDLVWWSLEFLSMSPRPHASWRCFSLILVNFVNPVHESDTLLFSSTFKQSSMRFSCITSRSLWVDTVTSIYYSGIGNVSSFGTYNWIRGWRLMKSPWIDQKSRRASTNHLLVLWVETLPIRLEDLHWVLHSFRFAPVLEWVPGIRKFQTIFLFHLLLGIWFLSLLKNQDFFCVDASRVNLWNVHCLQFLQVRNHNISFPDATRDKCIPRKMPGKTCLPNWWSLDWSRIDIGLYSTTAPNGIIGA